MDDSRITSAPPPSTEAPPLSNSSGAAEHQVVPAATGPDKSAWILMAAGLLFVLCFKLVPALVAGLFVYSLIHAMAAQMSGKMLSHKGAKIVAVSLIVLVIVGLAAGVTVLLIGFVKGQLGDLPGLLDKMEKVVEGILERYGLASWLPVAKGSKDALAEGLRTHSQALGMEVGRMLVNVLLGIVIGAMAAFETRRAEAPLAVALFERLRRLEVAFEKVVFAQVKISAVNTATTAVFLFVALPLFDVELPMRKTLVVFTFIVGLIPIVGNLISNTAIVIMALDVSGPAAVASLVFLVVIHKLQYFLNAKIVGVHIRASAWEILAALLCFEVAFGIPGLIMAPIVYAYVKAELTDRGLI
ncbi:MAG: AI-2E family transporter [Planctomycetota bacterium]